MQWYRDLYWPWDLEETLLGIRYCLTGLLLFAAFLALVWTFFGGSGDSVSHEQTASQAQQSVPPGKEL